MKCLKSWQSLQSYLIKIQDPASGPDGVKHTVVDDSVHGERHAVRGENLLGRDFIDTGPCVDTTNLEQKMF